MSAIIKVENISKQYRLGQVGTGSFHHDLNRWWHTVRGKEDPYLKIGETNDRSKKGSSDYVWALKDVNFEVDQGEVLGIIGRNGAGKSTLLKILSRTTMPTTGHIKMKGRVASLLEVGTGFHADLSGRENIYLNGAILGMRRQEINNKLDEIIDFAGVERYIDTPVKRYSSGMYVRLAFAVAAHLEPEILIVDEVLAVGDAEFQKKCLGKMKDVSEQDGRTVLFVSHDLQAVSKLTTRALLMQQGQIISNDETAVVIKDYLNAAKTIAAFYRSAKDDRTPHIKEISVKTSLPGNVHRAGEQLVFDFTLYTPEPIRNACFSFQLVDSKERNFVHQWLFDSEQHFCRKAGEFTLTCTIPHSRLYMGKYYLKCFFTEPPGGRKFDILENVCPFEVVMFEIDRKEFQWRPETCAYLEDANWTVQQLIPQDQQYG